MVKEVERGRRCESGDMGREGGSVGLNRKIGGLE